MQSFMASRVNILGRRGRGINRSEFQSKLPIRDSCFKNKDNMSVCMRVRMSAPRPHTLKIPCMHRKLITMSQQRYA